MAPVIPIAGQQNHGVIAPIKACNCPLKIAVIHGSKGIASLQTVQPQAMIEKNMPVVVHERVFPKRRSDVDLSEGVDMKAVAEVVKDVAEKIGLLLLELDSS